MLVLTTRPAPLQLDDVAPDRRDDAMLDALRTMGTLSLVYRICVEGHSVERVAADFSLTVPEVQQALRLLGAALLTAAEPTMSSSQLQ